MLSLLQVSPYVLEEEKLSEYVIDLQKGMKKLAYNAHFNDPTSCPVCYIQFVDNLKNKNKKIIMLIPAIRVLNYPYIYSIRPLGERIFEEEEYVLSTELFTIVKNYRMYLENLRLISLDAEPTSAVEIFNSALSLFRFYIKSQKRKLRDSEIDNCVKQLELGEKVKRMCLDTGNENLTNVAKNKLLIINNKIIKMLNGETNV